MRNLQSYIDTCLKEVEEAGIKHGDIKKVSVNNRAIKRYGMCSYQKDGTFSIEISKYLLDERIPEIELKNTIVHEILHTCKGCMNHGNTWKRNANLMNKKYGYRLTRVRTCKEFTKIVEEEQPYKYIVRCTKCGYEYKRRKKSRLIEHINEFTCGNCGGKLELL